MWSARFRLPVRELYGKHVFVGRRAAMRSTVLVTIYDLMPEYTIDTGHPIVISLANFRPSKSDDQLLRTLNRNRSSLARFRTWFFALSITSLVIIAALTMMCAASGYLPTLDNIARPVYILCISVLLHAVFDFFVRRVEMSISTVKSRISRND